MDEAVSNLKDFVAKNIGLIVGVSLVLILTLISIWWILVPSWEPLFGSMGTPDSRIEAEKKLMEWNIPFKEEESTAFILIESFNLIAVRKKLAELGIPASDSPGLEIFSEAEYGMSEFSQRINYQRAIESEISRTIRSFADVKTARVHLTIPKESIFKDKKTNPKASIVVQTKADQVLIDEQVTGIAQLVAASVDGLDADKVIILDHKGNVLSAGDKNSSNKKRHSSQNIEILYARKARDLIKGIVQSDNFQVAVNAELDFDKVKSLKEEILPFSDAESGFLKKIKSQQSTSDTGNKSSNLGGSSTVEKEFLFSKERSEIEYALGKIKRLSVGIVISEEISEKTIRFIEEVVSAGLGANNDRGDNIRVVSVPKISRNIAQNVEDIKQQDFNYSSGTNIASAIEQWGKHYVAVALFVLSFIFLIILLVLYKSRDKKNELNEEERRLLLIEAKAWLAAEGVKEAV